MDVKYIPADWDRMKDGLGDLIGLGRWGKGMIDDLKDITENLEDAESDIAKYDRDGVISFSHIDREGKYQSIFEDFKVLHDFSGKVGDIVDRTIDDPFHEGIDKFVTTMRDATISNYTTKNRIDATEQQVIHQRYGMQETREVPKAEVSLDDLLSGDNFYAEQLQLEYDMWKAEHPDQDFTQEEYRMAAVNMNSFEYESIKDQQHSEEFWANLGALVVVVGAAVICPPAGLVLGAVYGSMELKSAISGEDWISGRELGKGERWLRGALSPLDIVPGVAGLKKFSSGVRVANQAADMGQFGLRSGIKTSVQRELKHVGDMITTTGRQSTARLKSAGAAVKDRAIREAISAGKAADNMVTSAKNITSTRNVVAMDELGKVHMPAENTHFFENKVKDTLSKAEGAGGGKGLDDTIDIKTLKEVPAENVNKWWKDEMGYDQPPYKPGTVVKELKLTQPTTFVRVYDGENSRMYGGWFMKSEDIKGLNSHEIQAKFALPYTPKYIADLQLDEGTVIRTGTVNPLFGHQGGGTQFDLMGQFIGKFGNERLIGG